MGLFALNYISMKAIVNVYLVLILLFAIGCTDERASIIEEHISKVDGTVTDFNFKLISIVDLPPVRPIDSINWIQNRVRLDGNWRNIDSIMAKQKQYAKIVDKCRSLMVKWAGSDVSVFQENLEHYQLAIKNLKELQYYYELPQDLILSQKSACVYSIKNPFLGGVVQKITDTIYFTPDYKGILKMANN